MKNFVRPIIFISVMASSAFCAVSLFAQISLTGRVMTFDSVNVQSAVVVLRSKSDTNVRYSTMTDAQGRFAFLITKTEEESRQPASVILHQNYPNPFTDITTIRYELEKAANVRLEIFDALGRLVKRLVSAQQTAGLHTETWDGKNEKGEKLRPGVYFSALSTEKVKVTRKMLLGFEHEPHENGKGFAFESRFESGFQKSIFASEYSIDVIDTTLSLPRFETRQVNVLSVTRDTSIVIQVHLKAYDRWTFLGYDELYEPLKVYGDYLFGITKSGILRQNIRGDSSDRKLFRLQEIAGDQTPRIRMINDYIVSSAGKDSILVLIDPDNGYDPIIVRTINDGQNWNSIDSGFSKIYKWSEKLLALSDKILCVSSYLGMKTSTDFGLSWFTPSTQLFGGGIALTFEKSPSNDRNICMAGRVSWDTDLWFDISTDGGLSWKSISKILPDSIYGIYIFGNISTSVSYDVQDSILYISTTDDVGKLITTTNNYSQISSNGGGEIFANPKLSGQLFYFTNGRGLYTSIDYGDTWDRINGPYPIVGRYSNLAYDPQEHEIFIAFKIGIWKYKL